MTTRLLWCVHWSLLALVHVHHRLWWLTWLRALMHHHWSASTRTWISAVRLRRGSTVLRICIGRVRGIHLHLRVVMPIHSLWNTHVWTTGRLLNHHRCTHSILRIDKLRSTGILAHMTGLLAALVHVELWYGLAVSQLSVWAHRRRIGMLESR